MDGPEPAALELSNPYNLECPTGRNPEDSALVPKPVSVRDCSIEVSVAARVQNRRVRITTACDQSEETLINSGRGDAVDVVGRRSIEIPIRAQDGRALDQDADFREIV